MPTYEFRCPAGHEFEKFYRTISTAESVAACPDCGTVAERMMSATGFAFKGSGFYLTDYGKNAHRGEAPPSGSGSDAAAKESASKEGGSSGDTSSKEGGESPKASAPSEGGGAATKSDAPSSGGEGKKAEAKAEAKPAATAPAAKPKPSGGE